MTTAPFGPIIRTQTDLLGAWQTLMGSGGFSGQSLWMMWIVEDRPLPHLTEIAESEEPITGQLRANFIEVLRLLAADLGAAAELGVRVAFLLSRPGSDTFTPNDRGWARTLYDAARAAGLACETVHLATAGSVRPLPADEVGSPAG